MIGRGLAGLAASLLRKRRVMRLPILLYRAHQGILLDHRFLLLEHRGRRSGLVRRTVLEVVERPSRDRYLVVSSLGERAEWLRNLRAEPHARVAVGAHLPGRRGRGSSVLTRRPAPWPSMPRRILAAGPY